MSDTTIWIGIIIYHLILLVLGALIGFAMARTRRFVDEAEFTTDFYLKILHGPGAGQSRRITGVTVDEPFDSPATVPYAYEIRKK